MLLWFYGQGNLISRPCKKPLAFLLLTKSNKLYGQISN